MRLTAKLLLFFLVILFSCEKNGKVAPIDPAAKTYLDTILEQMKLNALNRKKINWETFKAQVYQKANGAKTIQDQKIKDAIQLALNLLGEPNSYFITNTGERISSPKGSCAVKAYLKPTLPSNIAYLKVDSYNSDEPMGNEFAEAIQNEIKKLDSENNIGWIIDLRGTTGENIWPILAGLGPLLGEGTIGYFIDYEGVAEPWAYQNGIANKTKVNNPIKISKVNYKIAVLIDQATASAGEAAAIAFSTKSNSKSFGEKTCGLTTINQIIPLIDGSFLHLTISLMADKNRKIYGNSFSPNSIETDPKNQIDKALNWLQN
jgi:carboxyl-terminal processing protease